MSLNRSNFYSIIRASLFNNKLSQSQVNGIEAILNEWESHNLPDIRRLAYMFGTIFHETAKTMQPIEEYGKGRGYKYGISDPITGKIYYGRGFVQLTWKANYYTMGKLLGYDLVNNPELALDLTIATKILFEGMLYGVSHKGDFTGKSLEQYFNSVTEDWVNARKIINGLDKANLIAGYSKEFYKALQ